MPPIRNFVIRHCLKICIASYKCKLWCNILFNECSTCKAFLKISVISQDIIGILKIPSVITSIWFIQKLKKINGLCYLSNQDSNIQHSPWDMKMLVIISLPNSCNSVTPLSLLDTHVKVTSLKRLFKVVVLLLLLESRHQDKCTSKL